MHDHRDSGGIRGEHDGGSGRSGGRPSRRRAEPTSSGPDACGGAAQPEPTVSRSDQTDRRDRQLLPVPVLRQQVQDLLPAQVPFDPAQRGAGECQLAIKLYTVF